MREGYRVGEIFERGWGLQRESEFYIFDKF